MSCKKLKAKLKTVASCLTLAPLCWISFSAQAETPRQPAPPAQSSQVLKVANLSENMDTLKAQPSEPFGGAPMQGKTRAADYYSKKLILKVAVPSKSFSDSGKHAYKPLFERTFISRVCVGGNLKCEISEYDADPRVPEQAGQLRKIGNEQLPPGMDILVWGGDIRLNKRAKDSLFSTNMGVFFEEGDITKLKRKYLRVNEPWRKSLVVGAQPDSVTEAREVCKKIKASCTFVVNKDFSVLDKKFKVNEIDLIIGDSWVFENKDLEDRIGQAMPD